MKKVLFKKWIPIEYEIVTGGQTRKQGTGCWEEEFTNEGLFHQWGNAYAESNEGFGNYTVGLVEIWDGTIVEVFPSNIKFVNS